MTEQQKPFKSLSHFIIGIVLLLLGVTLILVWWSSLVALFKGVIGFALAIVGLFILYNTKT